MSWSTSLLRMKPPCVVKPLHLCSPKAPRSRKRRRDSCFHNLNGYVKLSFTGEPRFTHAILNPPYKKIHSTSPHRLLLRRVGIETVNLYAAFVALTIELMQPGGQIVAIIPRSFCNGPYYRSFRERILARTAIKHIHLFGARDRTFKEDDVRQENIVIMLARNAQQESVTVSTSTEDSFTDMETHMHPFDRIVFPDDAERFIHIPTS